MSDRRVVLPSVMGLLLLACSHAVAQDPQPRRGFWFSAGYGLGSIAWRCDGCEQQQHGAGSLLVALGGTPGRHVLLGAEVNAAALDIPGAEIRTGYLTFTAYWYPKPDGGLFFKGGVGEGFSRRNTNASDAQSSAGAFMLGTGYDFRLGRRISISPMLTFWGATRANLKTDSATLETGFRQSGAVFQVGMTFHSAWGATKTPVQRLQIRRNVWLGVGFGSGNLAWHCDGCPDLDRGGGSGALRLGWTVSEKVLLGLELNAAGPQVSPPFEQFGRDTTVEDTRSDIAALTAYWYPRAAGGLFLKGGLGAGWYGRKQGSVNEESHAAAILVGTGYDIRVGRMVSFTPMLTLWRSAKADLKDGNTTLERGFRHSVATFQLGVTFH